MHQSRVHTGRGRARHVLSRLSLSSSERHEMPNDAGYPHPGHVNAVPGADGTSVDAFAAMRVTGRVDTARAEEVIALQSVGKFAEALAAADAGLVQDNIATSSSLASRASASWASRSSSSRKVRNAIRTCRSTSRSSRAGARPPRGSS